MDGQKKTATQRLVLDTHTNEGEQDYRMIAEAVM